jgi:glycosyltransferase involved in cell wall biosynthesis
MIRRLHQDFHISVVTMVNFTSRSEPLHDLPAGIDFHEIPTLLNVRIGGRFAAFKQLFGGLLMFSFLASALLSIRYSFPRIPTYVVSMNHGHAFLPALFALGRRVVRIGCVRGPYVGEMMRLFPKAHRFVRIANGFKRIAFRESDAIFANGQDTADVISEQIADPSKVRVIPNGVEYERFSRAVKPSFSAPPVVGMVCSLSPERGTDAVIGAARALAHDGVEFRMRLVGKGDIEKYTDMAHEMGVGDLLEIQGETSEVDKALAEMDITLALSDGWGISHSLLEEMASGKSVIALGSPAYAQVVKDGVNGLLVRDREPETLAASIKRLIFDEEYARGLGEGARKEAAKYDWPVVERTLRSTLAELVTSGHTKRR